jgi:hypothetical protein
MSRPGKEPLVQRPVIVGSLIAVAASAALVVLLLSHARPGLGGGDSSPRNDPAAFVSRIVGLIVADDYAAAWRSLNPAHQEIAPQSEYVECELTTRVGSSLKSIDVVRVADRLLRIPGASQSVTAKAITLRIEIVSPALGTSETFKQTFNAVPEGSDWTWILTPSRYALYRDDACSTA